MSEVRNAIGSGIAMFDKDNRILLQHRTDVDMWGIPGGILEIGEETEICARREIFEETNLEVGKMELFGVYSGKHMYWVYPDGNQYYFTSIVYLSFDFSGDLKADLNESKDVRFFHLNELPEVISTNVKMIEDLKKMIAEMTKTQNIKKS